MNTRYNLDKGWNILFKEMNVSGEEVLRHANLPLDLFIQKGPTVSAEEYFRFWVGLEVVLAEYSAFPLHIVKNINADTLSPVLFACLGSKNLNMALERISYYKPIEGPVRLLIEKTKTYTRVKFQGVNGENQFPASFSGFELAFWVRLARLATREHIVPIKIGTNVELEGLAEFEEFFGVRVSKSSSIELTFSATDAERPFLTANDAMWSIFEPALNKRLSELEENSAFSERVRACLIDKMPSGYFSIGSIADSLGVSSRTLQRRLKEEGQSFQGILDVVREVLAREYIKKTKYSNTEIAFLLGYEETNSFFRAFKIWTGKTPDSIRTLLTDP